MQPLLSVVIVTFNSGKWIERCLGTLDSQSFRDFEAVLVDNNSSDNTLDAIKSCGSLRVIRNLKNVGFAAACNIGIMESAGKYILIMNPDVSVQKRTIADMVRYLEKHDDVGIVSCQLRNVDGTLQYSCRRFPGLITQLIKRFFPESKIALDYLMANDDHSKIMDVDWLLGAFLLIRRDVVDYVGQFDERFFLYFEDTDICYRVKKSRWRVIYYPKVAAIHSHVRASRRLLSRENIFHLRSMLYYYRKHGIKLI